MPSLDDLYSMMPDPLDDSGNPEALDYIFAWTDDLMCAGKMDECNQIFVDADVYKITLTALVTMMMATHPGRHYLPDRKDFCRKARERMEKEIPDRVDAIFTWIHY